MKFIHIADMHFDIPFTTIAVTSDLGQKRRLEQRRIFKKMVDYVRNNNIPFIFISGDLYEQEYVKQTTIDYINDLFREIGDTKIFIAPGNHDPFIKNSYYVKYNWSENVHIFSNKIEKIEIGDTCIYGYGFGNFHETSVNFKDIQLDKSKKNILVMHGQLDGSKIENQQYNPISENEISSLGFDYIALGHVHKRYISKNKRVVYPGSMISMGFDELGEHGMIYGEIEDDDIKLDFIKLDETEFTEYEMNVSNIYTQEELIEKINNENWPQNKMYKLLLVGKNNFEINTSKITKMLYKENIIKIKDKTKSELNIEQLSNNVSLKGIFVRELMEKLKSANAEESEKIRKAIEIGIEVLEK